MITAHGAQKGFRVVVGAGVILASLMVGDLTAMMRMVRAFQGSISAASDAIATPEGVRRQHDGEDPADILHDYLVTSRSITKLESYVTSSEFATWVQSRGFASVGEYLDTVYTNGQLKRKAVHEAMSSKHNDTSIEMLSVLKQAGASLEASDGDIGFAPLHYAATNKMLGTARWLLEQGANPDNRNNDEKAFPVILAMVNGELGQSTKANEIVELLISNMDIALIAKRDRSGRTILHIAAQYNNLTCVRILFARSDVSVGVLKSLLACNDGYACGFRFKNVFGKNPLESANQRANPGGFFKLTYESMLGKLQTSAQRNDNAAIIRLFEDAEDVVTLADTKLKPDVLIKRKLHHASWPPSSSSSSSSSWSSSSSSNRFLTLDEEDDSY